MCQLKHTIISHKTSTNILSSTVIDSLLTTSSFNATCMQEFQIFRFFIDHPSHLSLQEATEGSLLLDILPAHRHCDAQHHDHHQKEAADHPCCDQRGSEEKTSKGEKKEGGQLVDDEETDENVGNEKARCIISKGLGLDRMRRKRWKLASKKTCL